MYCCLIDPLGPDHWESLISKVWWWFALLQSLFDILFSSSLTCAYALLKGETLQLDNFWVDLLGNPRSWDFLGGIGYGTNIWAEYFCIPNIQKANPNLVNVPEFHVASLSPAKAKTLPGYVRDTQGIEGMVGWVISHLPSLEPRRNVLVGKKHI